MGLDVHPKGSPPLSGCSWEYACFGPLLHVNPSVRIRIKIDEDYFHNEGKWMVRFEDGREHNLYEANKDILPPEAPTNIGGVREYPVKKTSHNRVDTP